MIVYRMDIIDELKKHGYTQAGLKRSAIFGGGDIDKLRRGDVLGVAGIDKLCGLLQCQPGTLLQWLPDDTAKKDD